MYIFSIILISIVVSYLTTKLALKRYFDIMDKYFFNNLKKWALNVIETIINK